MTERFECSVPKEAAGRRIDSFLAETIPEVSRATVQKWIEAGRVQVDGVTRKPSFIVATGQTVTAEPAPVATTELIPENIPLSILYEDPDLIVVDKPSGMVVHPGAGNRTGTLANALAFHFGNLSRSESLRPGIVHRLDKGTSGVLVVAKNDFTHAALSRQFKERSVKKEYLALVFGRVARMSGTISVPIGRDTRSRTRISPRTRNPRTALTDYKVIEHLETFTYLTVFPRTGRTHQIRVHLKQIGHPVVGDEVYGRGFLKRISQPHSNAIKALGRIFLHATSISFLHPRLGTMLTLQSPLPAELANLISILGE